MMKNTKKLIGATLATAVALTFASAPANSATTENMEKCYGIVKAAMNDCQTATQSCAGSSTKDKQPDAFILLPKGACAKIVGASLTPETTTK